MTFSEKTAREITKYIVRLVRRQPFWLKKLFDDDLVCFAAEDDGSLCLSVAEELPEHTKRSARQSIAKYMKTHPCKALGEKELH